MVLNNIEALANQAQGDSADARLLNKHPLVRFIVGNRHPWAEIPASQAKSFDRSCTFKEAIGDFFVAGDSECEINPEYYPRLVGKQRPQLSLKEIIENMVICGLMYGSRKSLSAKDKKLIGGIESESVQRVFGFLDKYPSRLADNMAEADNLRYCNTEICDAKLFVGYFSYCFKGLMWPAIPSNENVDYLLRAISRLESPDGLKTLAGYVDKLRERACIIHRPRPDKEPSCFPPYSEDLRNFVDLAWNLETEQFRKLTEVFTTPQPDATTAESGFGFLTSLYKRCKQTPDVVSVGFSLVSESFDAVIREARHNSPEELRREIYTYKNGALWALHELTDRCRFPALKEDYGATREEMLREIQFSRDMLRQRTPEKLTMKYAHSHSE